MSTLEAPELRYRYTFSMSSKELDPSEDRSKKEIQDFVRSTLGLMVGGCELCIYQDRLYCEKLGKLVKLGDTRCEYFARRPGAIPREHV